MAGFSGSRPGWTASLAALGVLVLLGAAPAAAVPPHPELARQIAAGERPVPDHVLKLRREGPPRVRGERSAGQALRERKQPLERGGVEPDGVLRSFPAPGGGIFEGPQAAPPGALQAPPVTGSVRSLTLLASFSDVAPWESAGYFDALVYGGAKPSVSHYFAEVSRSAFALGTEHLPSTIACTPGVGPCTPATPPGWLPLPGAKAAYRADLRAMLADAVAASDDAVDFSRYDNDGDGLVDYLILVHVGTGGEWSGDNADIWSQTLTVAPVATADGVSIDTFMTVPEYWWRAGDPVPTQMTIGVYAHEYGHLLGLPDLYDTGADSKGIGDWGLMGYGLWNGVGPSRSSRKGESPAWLSAWGRIALGWATPVEPASDLPGVTLAPVESGGMVYYLWNRGVANSEFFLIENRQKLAGSYDAFLPGSGLLVWHIDETMPGNDNQILFSSGQRHNDCFWPDHYRVALQQADGFLELEMPLDLGTFGDIADPYPGSFGITAFSPTSTGDFPPRTPPNSGSYADCSSLVAVRNIARSGAGLTDILADLEVGNTAPVALDDAVSTPEDTPTPVTLVATDDDLDPLTYRVVTPPAHGALTGTPPDLTYTPATNYFGPDEFTFVANDGYTDGNTATVSIDVTPVNDPPVLATVGDRAVDENQALEFTLAATDVEDDGLTYTSTALPDGATLDPATGAFSWTPGFDQAGDYPITFTVTDDGSPNLADAEAITVTVNDVNRAPQLATVGGKTVAEGELLSFVLEGSDPDLDTLTYSAPPGLPAGATLDEASGEFSWVPGYDQAGFHPVTFRVSDGSLYAEESITITVTDTNRAPQIDPVGDREVGEGSAVSFTVTAGDLDGDDVVLSVLGLPPGAGFDPATGAFSWTPAWDAAGIWTLTFRATDSGAPPLASEEVVAITVLDPLGPIFSDDFSDPVSSPPDWSIESGAWRWSAAQGVLRATSLRRRNLAQIVPLAPAGLPLGAGVIRARVGLTSRSGSAGPNGLIVFGYLNRRHYRWVKASPGRIEIGQTGTIDGIDGGVKKRVATRLRVGRYAVLTVQVHPDGRVEVYKGGATEPLVTHRFRVDGVPSVVPGGVGLGSLRARTLFDDVEVREDSALRAP